MVLHLQQMIKFLVQDQSTNQNGIYKVVASGALNEIDFNTVAELAGQLVINQEGLQMKHNIFMYNRYRNYRFSLILLLHQVTPE